MLPVEQLHLYVASVYDMDEAQLKVAAASDCESSMHAKGIDRGA